MPFNKGEFLMTKNFSIIVAADENNGIGKNNLLPWNLKGDMKYFKETTMRTEPGNQNVVIMGKNTWLSIPEKFRPLAGRTNIVLSRNLSLSVHKDAVMANSLDGALDYVAGCPDLAKVYVIGGGAVYEEAFTHPNCEEILLTRIHQTFDCDVFIPKINKPFMLVSKSNQIENDVNYSFEVYRKFCAPNK